MSRIGPPGIDGDELVSVHLKFPALKRFGNNETIGNLAREESAPKILNDWRRCLLTHGIDDLGYRNRLGMWETL